MKRRIEYHQKTRRWFLWGEKIPLHGMAHCWFENKKATVWTDNNRSTPHEFSIGLVTIAQWRCGKRTENVPVEIEIIFLTPLWHAGGWFVLRWFVSLNKWTLYMTEKLTLKSDQNGQECHQSCIDFKYMDYTGFIIHCFTESSFLFENYLILCCDTTKR